MAGPFALRSHKALLTRFSNNLKEVISQYEEDISLHDAQPFTEETCQRASLILAQLKGTSNLVLKQLDGFVKTVDALGDSLTEEQEAQAAEYMDKTQVVIDRAEKLIIQLEARNGIAAERGYARLPATQRPQTWNTAQVEMARPTLPAIPIPTFNGKIWEYDNFWTLFEANVHNQPLSKLQKFNYLISALRGEPRDLIKRYAVTEDNYDHAVELLRKKYGDESQLIAILQTRLENARAEQGTIAAQRKLLDALHPIVTQLEKLGVSLDGSFLAQKVISKFTVKLQRKVLERHVSQETGERDWKLQSILADLDSLINMEERVNDMVNRNTSHVASGDEVQQRRNTTHGATKPPCCIFCDAINHKSVNCRIYDTTEKRRKVMQEKQLCLNCGGKEHYARDCTSEGCRSCPGKRHHYTLCPKRFPKAMGDKDGSRRQISQQQPHTAPQPRKAGDTKQQRSKQTREHPVSTEVPKENNGLDRTQQPKTILHSEEKEMLTEGSVLLLTGSARIYNTVGKEWTDVEILFDTGADQSFISASLANKLHLESLGTESFQMYTFGSHEAKPTVCEMTQLELWDKEGESHNVRLYTTPVLTEKGKKVVLSNEDLKFLETRRIPLSITKQIRESHPQILLGCDQLWDFLEIASPRFTLPSGLLLIPSKFGYLITGKQHISWASTSHEEEKSSTSLSTIRILTNLSDFDEDKERWDKYRTEDSSGICKFTGTKSEEKAASQEKVESLFDSTIERRTDGYYVRSPFKESHLPLLTNKATPPLPTPEVFYRKFLEHSEQLNQIMFTVDRLEKDVAKMCMLKEKWSERLALLQMREHECERYRLELSFLKNQFRTFSVIPQFLDATNVMSKDAWEGLQQRQKRDLAGRVLMTDFDDINVAIEDHLAALEVISQRLLDIRKRMQQEERSEHAIREEQILTAINALTDGHDSTAKKIEVIESHLLVMVTTLKEMAENLKQADTQANTAMQLKSILDAALATMIIKMNEWQSLAQMRQPQETVARRETDAEKEVSLEEGPTAEVQPERELEEENVDEDDNDLVEEDLQLQDDAPNAEEQDENELREEELHLQEELSTDDKALDQEEDELAEQDPKTSKKDDEPKARESRRHDRIEDERRHQQLTEELEQVMEAERNFKQLIQDLANKKMCPPRRFTHGFIPRQEEKSIQCVFCKLVGHHYSDSCQIVWTASTRRDLLRVEHRCVMCLHTSCTEDKYCSKYAVKCYHCRAFGHHSAICELPERSEDIADQLRRARSELERNRERGTAIERQLRTRRH